MKLSQYNSIIPLSDKYSFIYNSLSGNFLIVSKKIIEQCFLKCNISHKDNELYQSLIDLGALIDDGLDEFAQVKQLRESVDFDSKIYELTINPTLDCNFKCWYCYENHVKKSKIEKETHHRIECLLANLINEKSGIKQFRLGFFGGEPFLQPSIILDIIDYTASLCEKSDIKLMIGITTNGFMLNKKIIEKLVKYKVPYTMQITLDGGREQHNKTRFSSKSINSYDRIINNMKLLLQHDVNVIARINYTADNIHSVTDIIKDLENIIDIGLRDKFRVTLFRVWQDANKGADIQNEVNYIIEQFNASEFNVTPHILNNIRNSCYADKKNEAIINYNGDVFRCTARDFTTKNREGYLDESGEIVWENDADNTRMNAKFKNKPCLSCRILPICNGGCSQKAIENLGTDYCIYGFDEKKIDNAILDIFKANIRYNPEWKR